MPALRRHSDEETTDNNQERTNILVEKFFPPPPDADLTDIAYETHTPRQIQVESRVTVEEVLYILKSLL